VLVRNAKACQVSLSRFGKQPTGEVLLFETETVTLAPGESTYVDDTFFASEGAQGYLADGTLVDVVAELESLTRLATEEQPAPADGEQGGEADEAIPEPDAQPARGRKRRGE
jgi:hypothetical protein